MPTPAVAEPSLRSYCRLVLRRRWWIAAFGLLGLAAGITFGAAAPRHYSATAQVLVQASTAPGAVAAGQQVTTTDVQTMIELVTSAQVQAMVITKLGAAPAVSASEVAQTNVIAIQAVSSSPARAALIANTYATAFVRQQEQAAVNAVAATSGLLRRQISVLAGQINKLRSQRGTAAQQSALGNQEAVLREQLAQDQVSGAAASQALELVSPARAPSSPSSPRPLADLALGLVAGLALGLAAAFIRDSLDDAVATSEAAEELTGAVVLAAVPVISSWRKRDRPLVISLAHPTAPATEAYRSLRTSLAFARQDRDLRFLLVTSPVAAEGKTSTLANLGAVFAQAGHRVLMVSCDLRRPRLGQFFGIEEDAGLTTALLGEQGVAELIQPCRGSENLWLLPSGPTPPNPAELLNGARAQEIFARLREQYDLVLVDSPPVLPVTDAVVLSKDVDATLLVVAANQTRAGDLSRAAEKLAQVDAEVIGLVLNETRRQPGGYYGDSYASRAGYYASDAASAS